MSAWLTLHLHAHLSDDHIPAFLGEILLGSCWTISQSPRWWCWSWLGLLGRRMSCWELQYEHFSWQKVSRCCYFTPWIYSPLLLFTQPLFTPSKIYPGYFSPLSIFNPSYFIPRLFLPCANFLYIFTLFVCCYNCFFQFSDLQCLRMISCHAVSLTSTLLTYLNIEGFIFKILWKYDVCDNTITDYMNILIANFNYD